MLLLFFFDEYRVSMPVPEYFWFVVYFVKYLNGYTGLYFWIIYLKNFLSFYLEIMSIFDIKLFHGYSIRMDYVSISSLLLHFYWEDETTNSELSMRIFFISIIFCVVMSVYPLCLVFWSEIIHPWSLIFS